MEQSLRRQLSTEEILAGRDNEEETLSDRCTICQFQRSNFQESRKRNEKENPSVSEVQRSLRTFFKQSKFLFHGKSVPGGG